MLCPIDQTTLVMSERKGIEIDYCPTCRGVWLDRGELDKVIDRSVEAEIAAENRPSAPVAPPAPAAPSAPNPVHAGPAYGSPQPAYDPRYDDRRRDDDRRYDRDRRYDDDRRRDDDRRYDSYGDRRYDPRYKKKRKESILGELFDF
jgi:Zn-finger nucleic acid-binding protein